MSENSKLYLQIFSLALVTSIVIPLFMIYKEGIDLQWSLIIGISSFILIMALGIVFIKTGHMTPTKPSKKGVIEQEVEGTGNFVFAMTKNLPKILVIWTVGFFLFIILLLIFTNMYSTGTISIYLYITLLVLALALVAFIGMKLSRALQLDDKVK
jgi:hypothetical protein